MSRYPGLNSEWSTNPASTIPKAAAQHSRPDQLTPLRTASSRISRAGAPYSGTKMIRLPSSSDTLPVEVS